MKHLLTALLLISACFSAHPQYQSATDGDTIAGCDSTAAADDATGYDPDFGPFPDVYNDIADGNFAKILDDAQNYLNFFPDFVPARYLRGLANHGLGNTEAAVADIVYVWQHDFYTDDLVAPYDFLSYYAQTVPEAVITAMTPVEQQLTSGTGAPYLLYDAEMILGKAYGYSGKWSTTARIYAPRAIAAVPLDLDSQYFFNALCFEANAWLSSGHPDKALKVMDRPEWTPEREESRYIGRSIALRNLGLLDRAVAYLDTVAARHPESPEILIHYASFLTASGQQDKAIELLDSAMSMLRPELDIFQSSLSDYCEALVRRGIARELKGRRSDAEADYLAAIDLDPGQLAALSRLGRRDDIMKLLSEAPAPYPEITLAMVYSNLGDDKEALFQLGRAFDLQQTSPQAIPYDPNLKRLMTHPDYPATAARFNPFPEAYNDISQGNFAKLFDDTQNYLDIFPDFVAVRYLRGLANHGLGNTKAAAADIVYAWQHDFHANGLVTPYDFLNYYAQTAPEAVITAMTPVEQQLSSVTFDPDMIEDSFVMFAYPEKLYNTEMLLGKAYGYSGKWATAAGTFFPRAIAAVPLHIDSQLFFEGLCLEAYAWLFSGHPDKVLEVMDRPEWAPDLESMRLRSRSIALRNLGRIDEAIAYLDSIATHFYTDDPWILVQNATFLSAAGQQDKAIERLDSAMNMVRPMLELYDDYLPFYTEILLRRGIVRDLKGDRAGAEADYLAVIEINPDHLTALSHLGRRDEIMKLLAEAPGPYPELTLTVDYYNIDPDDSPEEFLNAFFRASVTSVPDSELALAVVYSNLGDDKEALLHLGRAFDLQQTSPQAIPYDPSLKRLMTHPDYPATAARFNPDN